MLSLLSFAAVTLNPSIAIVGPGSLGNVLAKSLNNAGLRVDQIVYRSPESKKRAKALAKLIGATAVSFDRWTLPTPRCVSPTGSPLAPVTWLCVGDSDIGEVASKMAGCGSWRGMIVFHSSGALPSTELQLLKGKGAVVASVHPMMTFVRSSTSSMLGVPFALEGDKHAVALARSIVKEIGGESFVISKKDKPLYHALGAFVSPLIVAQMSAVEKIGRELRFTPKETRKLISPILQQTIVNYLEHGPAAAFSGPIVRGDAETVRKNMAALKRVPGTAAIYRALTKIAVEELPSKDPRAIKRTIR